MKPLRLTSILLLVLALLVEVGCKRDPEAVSAQSSAASTAVVAKSTIPMTNMVLIKAGSFTRGRQKVTLTHDYWLGKFEVTQGEFAALMGNNPSHFEGDTNRPVEKVKFPEAEAYCAALTKREAETGKLGAGQVYRLPTEAEWEYACLAGGTNLYSFGDLALADEYAWTLDNSEVTTHPVGQKKPNAWGLHDMHGNVWEWCSDWFAPFATNAVAVINPIGARASKYKVFKGGSWNHNVEMCRASSRFMMETNGGVHFVGFRVVLGFPIALPVATAPQSGEPTNR